MKYISYEEAKPRMRAGDILAFGGSSHFSSIIKMAIRAEVSHIGIVLQSQVKEKETGELCNYMIDSTSRNNVKIWKAKDRVDIYDGDVWWLQLRQDIRDERFDEHAFCEFLHCQEGKKYDRYQASGSVIDMFDDLQLPFGFRGPGYNKEDLTRLFCSELVAAGLKAGNVVPQTVNASEVSPIDLCRWNIYEPEYYLLKGEPKEISGYNSFEPSVWNV